MDRFQLDFGFLNEVVNPDTSRVPYKGNEDKFVRVAFDLFKTKDNSCEDLWKVQADDDGNEYLVRTYDVDDNIVEADWSVAIDKTASNLTISYKGTPIHRLAAANYNAKNEKEALLLRSVVQEKLATSKEFLVKFAEELPEEKREILVEMGAIDPADLAKAPGDYPDVDHGPGFQEKPTTVLEEPTDLLHTTALEEAQAYVVGLIEDWDKEPVRKSDLIELNKMLIDALQGVD